MYDEEIVQYVARCLSAEKLYDNAVSVGDVAHSLKERHGGSIGQWILVVLEWVERKSAW